MAQVQRTTLTLRFHGDDLDPEELSNRLGAAPTHAVLKGAMLSSSGAQERTAKTGQWRLTMEADAPDDLETLVARLFDQLSPEQNTWTDISGRYAGELFIGLFLGGSNEGVPISSRTLNAIAVRGLGVGLDIYAPTEA